MQAFFEKKSERSKIINSRSLVYISRILQRYMIEIIWLAMQSGNSEVSKTLNLNQILFRS